MRTTESTLAPSSPDQLVMLDGDHLVTDSRIVAKSFGKAHRNVVRIIDEMRQSKNPEIAAHAALNFERCIFDYVAGRGSIRHMHGYRMTRDGMSELTMGFTGDQARIRRIRFLAAFNAMAEHIANAEKNLWQRMQELIAKETQSQIKATFGSRLLHVRKSELRPLRAERLALESALQPSLLN